MATLRQPDNEHPTDWSRLYVEQDRARSEAALRRAQADSLRQAAATAAFQAQTDRARQQREVFNENADYFDPLGRRSTLLDAARAGIDQTRAGIGQTGAQTEREREATETLRQLRALVPDAGQSLPAPTPAPGPTISVPGAGMSVRPIAATDTTPVPFGMPAPPTRPARRVTGGMPDLGTGTIGQAFGMGALPLTPLPTTPRPPQLPGGFELDPETGAYTLRGRGRTPGYAKGVARVPGKGDGTKDTVKAKLAPGEAVLNKAAAASLGRGLIQRLNSAGATKMGMV